MKADENKNNEDALQKAEDMPLDGENTIADFTYPALLRKPDSHYYASHFSEFRQSGKFKPTWNWPAFFFGSLWFAYRGMFAFALLNAIFFSLFASVLSDSPLYTILFQPLFSMPFTFAYSKGALVWSGAALYILLNYLVVPASANYLYYLHAKRNAYSTVQSQAEAAPQESEFSVVGRLVSFWFIYTVLITIIVFAFASSTIQNQSRIMEKDTEPLIQALSTYQSKNGKFPAKLDQLAPEYLNELPLCNANNKAPMYFPSESGSGYILTCYTFVFLKHSYYSDTKKWRSWD